jgi:predicted TIM-barrel fold metal-dependent hydrolase
MRPIGNRRFCHIWLIAAAIGALYAPTSITAQPASAEPAPGVPVADYHAHISSLAVGESTTPPLLSTVELPPELDSLIKVREDYDDPAVGATAFKEDGLLLDTRWPNWVRGRDAVELWLSLTTKGLKYRPVEARIGDRFGYITGYVIYLGQDPAFVARNFHMSVEKVDGKWLIAAESWENRVPPLQRAHTAEEFIAELDDAGIRHGVVLSSGFVFGATPSQEDYAKVRAENDWTAQQAALYPERLVAFCGINPLQSYGVTEVERCAGLSSVKGIKLHFANDGIDLRQPDHVEKVRRVFAAANAAGLHIVAHVSNPAGMSDSAVAGEQGRAFLTQVLPVATDVTVQIPHVTGDTGWTPEADETFELFASAIRDGAPGTANLFFDISGTILAGSSAASLEMLANRMRQVGLERFLFGSDRSGARNPPPQDALNNAKRLPLSSEEFAQFFDNRMPYLP